jgi:LmbE family N-acetylglucosaminyl deacetylase
MKANNKRVLVLAPHTDDGEFGCGGTICRFIQEGAIVYYAAFSSCGISVPKGYPHDVLIKELRAAAFVLGLKKNNLLIFDFPVRRFDHYRQEILEELVNLQRNLDPDMVFMPSQNDLHQDHFVVAMEGRRAFKQSTIFAYEMPWNNITFSTQAFIKLEESHLARKLEALKKYESQSDRPYANEEFIRGIAKARGISAGGIYAEAFEVVRFIV